MGVKKTMDTFFASMQEQSMSGYNGRLVNTPMGPFRWNDTMQLWENVNNGMVMNNISFQDSIMMLDYSTIDGGYDGIIAVVPSIDPNKVLILNFYESTLGVVTFSRNSAGRFINSNGFVRGVSMNTPRFSYYPTGTTVGLLIESSSQNLLPLSQRFVDSPWTVYTQDSIPTIVTSEEGSSTDTPEGSGSFLSYKLIPVGDTFSRHYIHYDDLASLTAGSTYTVSVWAKSHGNTFNRYFGIVASNNNARAYYDLQTGSAAIEFANLGNENGYAKISGYTNGWQRLEMTWVATSGLFSLWFAPLASYDISLQEYYASTSNEGGIRLWGAQVEENTYASSFIRTTGSTVTRGNDLAYLSGTGFTWFNGSCGTFVFEFDKKPSGHTADNIKTRTVMRMNYDSSNNYGIALDYIIGSTVASIRAANGNMLLTNNGLTNGMNKVSFSYNNNGSQMEVTSSVNGSTTQSQSPDIGDFNISGVTFMTLGYKQALVGTTAYDYLDTTIRSVQYWNKALSGASLQQLST